MGRHRLASNKGLNGLPLYPAEVDGRTYYRFKDPKTGAYKSLGSDRAKAIKAASILLSRRAEDPIERLVRRVDAPKKTVGDAKKDFIAGLEKRTNKRGEPLSQATIRDYKNMLERFDLKFGMRDMRSIDHGEIADWLEPIPARQANMLRGILSQFWTLAVARSWASENVVDKTMKVDEVKIRSRLFIEDFKDIQEGADEWLAAAMDVALYSILRREDVVTLPVEKWNGEEGTLAVKLGKTGKEISISTGPNMRKAIEHALTLEPRDAPTIVRRKRDFEGPGNIGKSVKHNGKTHVSPAQFTDAFAAARDKLPRFAKMTPVRSRPTVHEIRSLGAAMFLWKCRDIELVRKLLGHESVKQTQDYLRGHALPPEIVQSS